MTNELSIYKNGNFHLKEQNIDKGFKEGHVSMTVHELIRFILLIITCFHYMYVKYLIVIICLQKGFLSNKTLK